MENVKIAPTIIQFQMVYLSVSGNMAFLQKSSIVNIMKWFKH